MEWQQLVQDVQELARKVGQHQLANLGRKNLQMETKSSANDLVTEVDKQSEAMIMEFIRTRYPDHAVLAEESGHTAAASEYLWVVDPLDGTTNYAQGLPIFAVSIGVQYRQQTMAGVIYVPALDAMYSAVRGQGAFCNGVRLAVSDKTELAACVLATGFPYDIVQHPLNNLDYFSVMSRKVRAVRRFGAAAYDLACVAAGTFDGFWEMNLSPWDVTAGLLLVEEAGGTVIPFRDDRRISIIVGNARLCQDIQAVLQAVDAQR